jgi:hypothetical protein
MEVVYGSRLRMVQKNKKPSDARFFVWIFVFLVKRDRDKRQNGAQGYEDNHDFPDSFDDFFRFHICWFLG